MLLGIGSFWPTPRQAIEFLRFGVKKYPQRYHYHQDLGHREIRVLLVEAGHRCQSLQCSLQIVNLDHDSHFAALSYTWGDPTKTHFIVCDGMILAITKNLFGALSEMRQSNHDSKRQLFVDAVCINQADISEKTRQVRLMEVVYKCADPVIAWLGVMTEADSEGLQLLFHLDLVFKKMHDDGTFVNRLRSQNDDLEALGLPSISSPKWQSLRSITQKSWFSRVWIIQECVLAYQILFLIGSQVILSDELLGTLWIAEQFSVIRTALASARPAISISVERISPYQINAAKLFELSSRRSQGKAYNLIELLEFAEDYKAGYPIDRIYALIGLSHDFDATFIDYSVTVELVVLNVSILILTGGRLNSISNSINLSEILSHANPSTATLKLPSWCPDWTQPRVRYPITYAYPDQILPPWCQCSDVSIEHDYSLRIRGKIFDHISVVVSSQGVITPVSSKLQNLDEAKLRVYKWLYECSQVTTQLLQYPTGEPLDEVYWRTMCFNTTFHFERASQEDRSSFESWCLTFGHHLQRGVWGDKPMNQATSDIVSSSPSSNQDRRHESHAVTPSSGAEAATEPSSKSVRVPTDEWFVSKPDRVLPRFPPNADILAIAKGGRSFNAVLETLMPGRKFCATAGGYVGWVPEEAEIGDWLCVMKGSRVPFVLHSHRESPNRTNMPSEVVNTYTVLGDSYLHGLMDYEPWHRCEGNETTLRLL